MLFIPNISNIYDLQLTKLS